ncbi:MAG: ACP S-malonyltransferase [Acidimicrobiales bacterium]
MAASDHAALRADLVGLFPGQGSIAPGAGVPWRSSPHWQVVERVSEVTGTDVGHLLLDADEADVIRTDNAQLATFALSLVAFRTFAERSVRPQFHLGHSLGEFSALTAAGVLDLEDGARLIATRGTAMARAAEERAGSMVALMGGDDEARRALADLTDLWVANINGTGQLVVSGTRVALDDLLERHRELGWRRATPLPVGGAFHSPLMASAQSDLDEALARVTWHDTEVTVIANVDASVHQGAQWRDLLSRQLTEPVDFLGATLALADTVTTSVEMAPGAVLTGLCKRIRDFETQVVLSDPASTQGASL